MYYPGQGRPLRATGGVVVAVVAGFVVFLFFELCLDFQLYAGALES